MARKPLYTLTSYPVMARKAIYRLTSYPVMARKNLYTFTSFPAIASQAPIYGLVGVCIRLQTDSPEIGKIICIKY